MYIYFSVWVEFSSKKIFVYNKNILESCFGIDYSVELLNALV